MKNEDRLNELRKELVEKELTIDELDYLMTKKAFYSEAASGIFEYSIQEGSIEYAEITDDIEGDIEPTVRIFFDVVDLTVGEEDILSSILRITKIEGL